MTHFFSKMCCIFVIFFCLFVSGCCTNNDCKDEPETLYIKLSVYNRLDQAMQVKIDGFWLEFDSDTLPRRLKKKKNQKDSNTDFPSFFKVVDSDSADDGTIKDVSESCFKSSLEYSLAAKEGECFYIRYLPYVNMLKTPTCEVNLTFDDGQTRSIKGWSKELNEEAGGIYDLGIYTAKYYESADGCAKNMIEKSGEVFEIIRKKDCYNEKPSCGSYVYNVDIRVDLTDDVTITKEIVNCGIFD